MIGTIDIHCNAANPNLPLKTLFAFVNSPSSLRIIDVPKKIGKWKITGVSIKATYPDNTTKSTQCVLVGGCYVGTIQGSTATGKGANGYYVLANGIDENGEEVNGYVLGNGDVVILDSDTRIFVDDKAHYLHLFEDVPDDPKEGDVVFDDEVWKVYHDGEWHGLSKQVSWGDIGGDLSSQTDLKNALDEKADKVDLEDYALKDDVDEDLEQKRDNTDNICHETSIYYGDWSRDNLPQIPDNTWNDQPYWDTEFNCWIWLGNAAHAQKFNGSPDDDYVKFYYESASSSGEFVTARVVRNVATKDSSYVTQDYVDFKRDKTDNVCASDTYGDKWMLVEKDDEIYTVDVDSIELDPSGFWAINVKFAPDEGWSYVYNTEAGMDAREITTWFSNQMGKTYTIHVKKQTIATSGKCYVTQDYVDSKISELLAMIQS